jgi:hypothetical protein
MLLKSFALLLAYSKYLKMMTQSRLCATPQAKEKKMKAKEQARRLRC